MKKTRTHQTQTNSTTLKTTGGGVFANCDLRHSVFAHKRHALFVDECFDHGCLDAKDQSREISSLFQCPCGHKICNVCAEYLFGYSGCDICYKIMCLHCYQNNFCFKCERSVCDACYSTSYCEHCNKVVCTDCGYDFCERCTKVVCADCGKVMWRTTPNSAATSVCTFCAPP